MATTKKRLNVTLSPHIEEAISVLAKRDKVPQSRVAAKLLEDAIESLEDEVLLEMALERDTKNVKWLDHEEFWKKIKDKT